MSDDPRRAEVDRNYVAFKAKLDEYMLLHADEYALMRGGEVVAFYPDWKDAWCEGHKSYEDGIFSIQEVTKTPIDLGYFSHVVPF